MFNEEQNQSTETPQVAQPETSEAPKAPEQQAAPAPKKAPVIIKTTQDERMWAAIGYLFILGVISMAIKPKSDFCKKHATQGLVIFVGWFISLILMAIVPALSIIFIGFMALAALGIFKAIQSQEMNLPVIKQLAEKIPTGLIFGKMTGKDMPKTEPSKPAEAPAAPTETPAEKPKEEVAEAPAETTEKPAETPAPVTEQPETKPEEPVKPTEETPAEEPKEE